MEFEGKVGIQSLANGTSAPIRLNTEGAVVVSQAHGKYYEAVKAGRVYVAANQAAVAVTAAMATTYTGLVLFNPSASGKDFVMLGCGYTTGIAVPTATAIGLMTGTVITAATMDAAAAITPRNRLVGSTSISSAIVDNACTLNGTPVLEQVFSHAWTEATTAGSVGSNNWQDLDGSMIVQPGSYVAFYSYAANTAAFVFSFMWEEVPR
jgi:hypothetical protein